MNLLGTLLASLAFTLAPAHDTLTPKDTQEEEVSIEKVALSFLQENEVGMVATIVNGKPFCSIMPYSLDKTGRPVVLISDLAVHTENVNKNPIVSILVYEPDETGDIFNGARATLNGKMVIVSEDDPDYKDLRARYLKKYKDAEQWVDFGDFNFYRLELEDIFFVGGFGIIDWLDLDTYKKEAGK